jgi:hypothetical protein
MNNQNNNFGAYVNDLLRQAQQQGPDAVMNMLAQRNPRAAQEMNRMLSNGITPQQAAMSVLQQMGINPNMFTGGGPKR